MDDETLRNSVWKLRSRPIVRRIDSLECEMHLIASEELIENFELTHDLMTELLGQHRPQGKRLEGEE